MNKLKKSLPGLLAGAILCAAMLPGLSASAAVTKFDFANSLGTGKWLYTGLDPITVQENTLVLPMSTAVNPISFFYDDGNLADLDLEFEIKLTLDEKCEKSDGTREWSDPDTWCFLMALRDTYYEVPYWNTAEAGSYTLMYHPKAGGKSTMAHWASANRPNKKGETQYNEIPDLADGSWHKLRFTIEDIAGKDDKVKFTMSVDGREYSNYEANKTSEKGYVSFYNLSCKMQLRAVGGAGPTATTPPIDTEPSDDPEDTTTAPPTDGTTAPAAPLTAEVLKSSDSRIKVDFAAKAMSLEAGLTIRDFLEAFSLPEGYTLEAVNDGSAVVNRDKVMEGDKYVARVLQGDAEAMRFKLTIAASAGVTTTPTTSPEAPGEGGFPVWAIVVIIAAAVVIAGGAAAVYFFVIKKKKNGPAA